MCSRISTVGKKAVACAVTRNLGPRTCLYTVPIASIYHIEYDLRSPWANWSDLSSFPNSRGQCSQERGTRKAKLVEYKHLPAAPPRTISLFLARIGTFLTPTPPRA
jgi:hypothetical protein